jgi:hypothetical protein
MKIETRLAGLPIILRPTALLAGIVSALVIGRLTNEQQLALGAAAGVLWYTADATHVVGHVISSQAIGAPMKGIDFGIYPMSVYTDHDVSPQQHIGRAIGGISASLIACLLLSIVWQRTTQPTLRKILLIAAAQHGILFLLSLLPTKLVDGGVIYHNLAKLRQSNE